MFLLRIVCNVLNFAENLIVALAEAKVEFIVVGGISAVMNGAPIVTRDIDICYRRVDENLVRLADALKPFQPRLRDLPEGVPNIFDLHSLRLGTNFTLTADGQALDLLGLMSGIGGYDDIIGRTIAHYESLSETELDEVPLDYYRYYLSCLAKVHLERREHDLAELQFRNSLA